MKHLAKKEIIELMRFAGNYQREVFQLYDIGVIEITKSQECLSVSVHYDAGLVSFSQLLTRFVANFVGYEEFIDKDLCFSTRLWKSNGICAAHFELKFYA